MTIITALVSFGINSEASILAEYELVSTTSHVVLQLNTDWTSSHIDWLSGATAGSLLVLHLELCSGQFVRMNCRRSASSTAHRMYGHKRCLCMMGP